MYFIKHRCLLCLPPFVSRTHHWRRFCFSRDCSGSGHGFTVLSIVQEVKKNTRPARSSLAFGPALWLCPAKELHSPSPHSSLIFGHSRDTTKSHRRHKSCALDACVSLLLTSTRNLVDMTKVTSEVQCAGSLLLMVGGMRQQMRMA